MRCKDLIKDEHYILTERPGQEPQRVRFVRILEREGAGKWVERPSSYPGIEDSDYTVEVETCDKHEIKNVRCSDLRTSD